MSEADGAVGVGWWRKKVLQKVQKQFYFFSGCEIRSLRAQKSILYRSVVHRRRRRCRRCKTLSPPPPPPSASNQLSWQRLDRKLSSDISIKNVAGAFASVPKRIAAFFTSQLFCLSVFLQQTDFERKKKDKGRKK